jgi:hypothetical protein
LKGIATSILSLILFLSLSIFSLAFMLHGTVLNQDFVTAQVDKMPISELTRDFADEIISPELPQDMPFAKDIAMNVIEKQEPWIKTQLKDVIDTGYDYLMDRTDTLSITVPLTELKASLQDTLWDETRDYLREQTAGKSEAQISAYIQDLIRQIPENIMPPELEALPRDLRNLAIEQYIRDFAGLNTIGTVPPEIYGSIEDQAKVYFDQYLQDFIRQVPDTLTFNQSDIDSQTMDAISTGRKAVSYFQTYYYWLIILMIVLAALIFLVNMNIRATARSLGVSLTIFGVIDLAGIIISKSLPLLQIISDALKIDIPDSLKTWIEGLINDVTGIAMPLTIGILAAGVLLLVVSFILKSKKA